VETLTFYGQGLELTDPMNFGFSGIAAAKGGRVPRPGASNELEATVSEVVLVPARL
jgi:hypothetical protein